MSLEGEARLARRVTEALRPFVSENRQRRIDAVLRARTRSTTVLLEDVVNERNVAAVLRTADALGLMELHTVLAVDGLRVSRKIARGSQKWVEIHRYPSIESGYAALRRRGFEIWVSAVHGQALEVSDLPSDRPIALVFGNEVDGVSERAVTSADGLFRVPMYGFAESLNVSVAVALALAAVIEPRRRAGTLVQLHPDDRARTEARWYTQSVRASIQLLARSGLEPLPRRTADVVLVDDPRDQREPELTSEEEDRP